MFSTLMCDIPLEDHAAEVATATVFGSKTVQPAFQWRVNYLQFVNEQS